MKNFEKFKSLENSVFNMDEMNKVKGGGGFTETSGGTDTSTGSGTTPQEANQRPVQYKGTAFGDPA